MLRLGSVKKRFGFVAVLSLVASVSLVQGQTSPTCTPPEAIGDGWITAAPESVGLDSAQLCAIGARLKFDEADVHAVVVVRHGKLVFEQYFRGYDEPWGAPNGPYDFEATSKHDLRSISKSVISLLIGVAIGRELIAGPDQTVANFFADATPKRPDWDRVTVGDLLTMSSGMAWNENLAWTDPANDEPHLGQDADPIGYVLKKPMIAPPGTIWNYNGGGIDLLGAVIERTSGKPLADFARDALFEPLGISDWEWKPYRNGKISSAAGLRLRPRDAAKIGQLMLDHGMWQGRQIVSAAWIAQASVPRFQASGYFGGLFYYGYSWWMGRSLTANTEVKWIAGVGLGGQRLFIVPDLDIVVMSTSGLYGSPRQGQGALDILNDFVIRSVREPR
jgi:CubicO group peptidase (beta-lactamase class C family)